MHACSTAGNQYGPSGTGMIRHTMGLVDVYVCVYSGLEHPFPLFLKVVFTTNILLLY
jgi:hypothetical protein